MVLLFLKLVISLFVAFLEGIKAPFQSFFDRFNHCSLAHCEFSDLWWCQPEISLDPVLAQFKLLNSHRLIRLFAFHLLSLAPLRRQISLTLCFDLFEKAIKFAIARFHEFLDDLHPGDHDFFEDSLTLIHFNKIGRLLASWIIQIVKYNHAISMLIVS